MFPVLWNLFSRLRWLASGEDGQDLVEYALLIGMIAFGATAGMQSLATILSTTYNHLETVISTNIT